MDLKLMADYDCFPLWESDNAGSVNVDPGDLPITSELVALLREWGSRYDETLNRADPTKSGFESDESEREFVSDGYLLAERLSAELGAGNLVRYFNESTAEVVRFEAGREAC